MKFANIIIKGAVTYTAIGAVFGALSVVGKRQALANPEECPGTEKWLEISDAEIMMKVIAKWPAIFKCMLEDIKTTK